jgi:hypothetical protein
MSFLCAPEIFEDSSRHSLVPRHFQQPKCNFAQPRFRRSRLAATLIIIDRGPLPKFSLRPGLDRLFGLRSIVDSGRQVQFSCSAIRARHGKFSRQGRRFQYGNFATARRTSHTAIGSNNDFLKYRHRFTSASARIYRFLELQSPMYENKKTTSVPLPPIRSGRDSQIAIDPVRAI